MAKTLEDFNREYLSVHTKKENLFWTTYMGVEKDGSLLEKAETEFKSYISDPKHLAAVREAQQAKDLSPETRAALKGWLAFFDSHAIESESARTLQKELIELESAIFQKRAKLQLFYKNKDGQDTQGSTNVLSTNLAASDNENVRKTSHEALLRLEQWVLSNGFIELVKKRNQFAQALGYQNYFEYRVQKNERMTREELVSILNEFETLTRETCLKHLEQLARQKGKDSVLGHNLKFAAAGDAEKQLNPYFRFEKSLETWMRSFARLGIGYRGATLHLDLFDRPGKYENGFMHGPGPCFYDKDRWQPARINFTSNATPTQIGSGRKALLTLFHEGGHAAHFSNITKNAPCFSQEYPPTSMAYAETQSMFCDSLINDADWLKLYAKDVHGQSVPDEVIRNFLTSDHPFMAFQERSILVVPVFEDRLYSLAESEMTPAGITALARRCEKEILGVDCSPRPILAIPHLLGAESACSYQGYLLAHMAVYQTRSHFERKYGYLADNPKVGADLATHYWNPGNSLSHRETIQSLTGATLSGRPLAEFCNLKNDDLWEKAKQKIEAAARRNSSDEKVQLDASIHIVHGAEIIASNTESASRMWRDFETWIEKNYKADITS